MTNEKTGLPIPELFHSRTPEYKEGFSHGFNDGMVSMYFIMKKIIETGDYEEYLKIIKNIENPKNKEKKSNE